MPWKNFLELLAAHVAFKERLLERSINHKDFFSLFYRLDVLKLQTTLNSSLNNTYVFLDSNSMSYYEVEELSFDSLYNVYNQILVENNSKNTFIQQTRINKIGDEVKLIILNNYCQYFDLKFFDNKHKKKKYDFYRCLYLYNSKTQRNDKFIDYKLYNVHRTKFLNDKSNYLFLSIPPSFDINANYKIFAAETSSLSSKLIKSLDDFILINDISIQIINSNNDNKSETNNKINNNNNVETIYVNNQSNIRMFDMEPIIKKTINNEITVNQKLINFDASINKQYEIPSSENTNTVLILLNNTYKIIDKNKSIEFVNTSQLSNLARLLTSNLNSEYKIAISQNIVSSYLQLINDYYSSNFKLHRSQHFKDIYPSIKNDIKVNYTTVKEICDDYNISKSSLYRFIKKESLGISVKNNRKYITNQKRIKKNESNSVL